MDVSKRGCGENRGSCETPQKSEYCPCTCTQYVLYTYVYIRVNHRNMQPMRGECEGDSRATEPTARSIESASAILIHIKTDYFAMLLRHAIEKHAHASSMVFTRPLLLDVEDTLLSNHTKDVEAILFFFTKKPEQRSHSCFHHNSLKATDRPPSVHPTIMCSSMPRARSWRSPVLLLFT